MNTYFETIDLHLLDYIEKICKSYSVCIVFSQLNNEYTKRVEAVKSSPFLGNKIHLSMKYYYRDLVSEIFNKHTKYAVYYEAIKFNRIEYIDTINEYRLCLARIAASEGNMRALIKLLLTGGVNALIDVLEIYNLTLEDYKKRPVRNSQELEEFLNSGIKIR